MSFKEYALSRQTEICLELQRVKLLIQKAGNPDRKLKIIHVAGTNGKGSVCSFVCGGLKYMGKKTGRFSSPELFCVNDTISIDGGNIPDSRLDELLAFLSPLCDEVKAETQKSPSQFEICFVAALLYFAEQKCEYAVLECGMGGAGDATNAVDDSFVSVITHIALDHMQYLGNTVEKIAENKCGIFKKSSTVIAGSQEKGVADIIRKAAGNHRLVEAKSAVSVGHEDFCEIFEYDGMKNLKSSLCGTHQIYNASIAIEVLRAVGANEETIRYALSHAENPARFERIGKKIFFDGAHNPDGVNALVTAINRYQVTGKIIFVAGFMSDKSYEEALEKLNSLNNKDFEIYTVNVCTNPRSEKSQKLCETARSLGFVSQSFNDVNEALENAFDTCDWVFVFGSLYMYKEINGLEKLDEN